MDVSAHQTYFGCPIHLGAQHNCLHLDLTSLVLSFQSYNAELLDLLTPALDQKLSEYQSKLSFIETVSWLLKRLLSAGRPDIPAVALELGVSERTLQRRLTEEGTNFQRLLATVRRSRAYELLADPSLYLMEVALLLGYEDQSSFFVLLSYGKIKSRQIGALCGK
ncbi:AraC-like DNA-binding protein [Providencia alcalifaciens]|nr:AraC-like DNA-binding protein [Providencia alcalifaciens]